jgi:hypothetical protein
MIKALAISLAASAFFHLILGPSPREKEAKLKQILWQ